MNLSKKKCRRHSSWNQVSDLKKELQESQSLDLQSATRATVKLCCKRQRVREFGP